MLRWILAGALLLAWPALAEDGGADRPSVRWYIGPAVHFSLNLQAQGSGAVFGANALVDTGNWMAGLDVKVGSLGPASILLGYAGRVDRYLWSEGDAPYVGATFGYLSEFDGENYGGEGPFAGAQLGYVFGRERRWLRAAVEAQVSIPLFGERPNKPGDYVYPFVTFGLRLFL